MGERAKVILNEYSAKNLLMRDTLDLDKFYTADLKLFVEVARKEIKRLKSNEKTLADLLDKEQKKNKEAIEYITEEITKGTDVYCEEKVDGIIVLEILKGDDK